MADLAPLDEAEVRQFVADWYHALDVHVPPDEALAMVAEEGLEFHIPEGIFRGQEGFSEVYHNWTHTFFDEVHTLRDVQVSPNGLQANLKVVVNWQGKVWNSARREQRESQLRRIPDLGGGALTAERPTGNQSLYR